MSRDGVHSHGLTLFPRLMTMIGSGVVDVRARAARLSAHGAIERWDGRRGVGALNAHAAMAAAVALSREHGIGCVALAIQRLRTLARGGRAQTTSNG